MVQFNGPGTDDYRIGDTVRINVGTSYPIHPKVGLLAQMNFLLRDRDDKGRTREEIEKTGGEFLYFSPRLEFRPSENWRAYAVLPFPIYQRTNSIQLVSDYNILMGARFRFGLGSKRRAVLL